MNKFVMIGIVAILIIIIIVVIVKGKNSGAAAPDNTMGELAAIMKDPKQCKIDCKNECAAHPIFSFTGGGRRKCKKECKAAC